MFSDRSVRSTKSKEKCYTCRRQRIVCDAGKPSCMRCISRGVECLGYSATPIRWVAPTSTLSSEAPTPSNISHIKGQERRKRGRPKLFLMQAAPRSSKDGSDPQRSDEELESQKAGVLVSRSRSSPTIPWSLFPYDYDMQKMLLEFSHYFNDHICPELVIVDSPLNPHRMDLDILPYVPDFLLSLVISVSAIHQVIQSQPNWHSITLHRSRALRNKVHPGELEPLQSFQHPLNSLIYKHRSRSLRGLNQYLSEAGAEGPDLVFHTVTAMLMSEIQRSAFCNWKIHFEGLKNIIACQGGFEVLVSTRLGNLRYSLSHFMLVDVMSSVFMAASCLPLDTPSQLRYIDWLPEIHSDGLESGFPCPDELLACIIHTNNLRFILHHHPYDDMAHVNSAINDLVRNIITFSPTTWAERALESYNERLEERVNMQRRRKRLDLVPRPVEGEGWADLASTFQAATLLYCSYEALSERPFIVRSLQELCRCLGDMSALDAAVFLQSAWSRDEENHSGNLHRVRTWDELFEGVGLHGVFFF